jgi:hypothetical protein
MWIFSVFLPLLARRIETQARAKTPKMAQSDGLHKGEDL